MTGARKTEHGEWRRRERGFAMIAAVAAVGFFGYLALVAVAGGRGAVDSAEAGLVRARLSADADAGLALAIHELALSEPTRRWSLTDPPRRVGFQGARLTITVEDENGKIPVNFIRAEQLHRLFDLAGADPGQIDALVAAFIDLRGDPRPGGETSADAAVLDPRIAAQRGPLTSLDELLLLPGMSPALFARIAPALTVHAATPTFDPRTASPLALAVMAPSAPNGPAPSEQVRDRTGAMSAAPAAPISLAGRTLALRVDAEDGQGGRFSRTEIVEFTGAAVRPYVVRGIE
jgi:general secretion pathway protein K